MTKYITGLLVVMAAFATVGCEDIETPYNEFEDLEKGAYPRGVDRTGTFAYADPAGSTVTSIVEFYDENKGQNVAKFSWDVAYSQDFPAVRSIRPAFFTVDSTRVIVGTDTTTRYDTTRFRADTTLIKGAYRRRYGPVEIASQTADQWTLNESGLPQATYTFNFAQVLAALNIPIDSVEALNNLRFTSTLTKKDGKVFTAENTDLQLIGQPTFNAQFSFNQPVVCPSVLEGTYTAVATGTSTNRCCTDPVTVTSKVTIAKPANTTNRYTISDFSGGLYLAWYGPSGANLGVTTQTVAGNQLRTTALDICNDFRIASFLDFRGATVRANGRVNGQTITYTFVNGFGDTGTVTLTKD